MSNDSSEKDLAQDFNDAARQYLDGEIADRLLLTKFGLLMDFRARETEEKDRLAAGLLDCALKFLKKYATPDQIYIGSDKKASAATLLAVLVSEDNAAFLPRRAPGALADLGLEFVGLAQLAQDDSHRENMTDFAALCLEHAEKFRGILEKRDDNISTSKPITPGKPLVLKAGGRKPPTGGKP